MAFCSRNGCNASLTGLAGTAQSLLISQYLGPGRGRCWHLAIIPAHCLGLAGSEVILLLFLDAGAPAGSSLWQGLGWERCLT